ncbi:hypothetical protein [uncultured Psychroserpens sp.]|uniref:hypothetical protein n=1 Tax=uncultured Psychroserpens sp. TaxID=255436 RepID=UPI0026297002|nr:hypothetical protein [uncultured Psychroserpens sp.]
MAALKYIDHPVAISVSQYEALKEKLVYLLMSHEAILSVYQMGSVKHPGISDLDIICVFKNDSQCHDNFRLQLTPDEKSILTHGIFGIQEKDLLKSMSYNLISNLKHLGGEKLIVDEPKTNIDLKQQIALEYLVKMLITIDAQVTLKIVKLRAFLLLAKAIEFDLELLGVNNGKLYELVKRVIQYRSQWYINTPNKEEITSLILSFNDELRLFLSKELQTSRLYLPAQSFSLPGNFSIQKSESFSINHSGFVLPNQFSFLGRKYINLQNRLNSFAYGLPFEIPSKDSIHEERFQFSKKMVQTNRQKYPHFIPLTTSLSIY